MQLLCSSCNCCSSTHAHATAVLMRLLRVVAPVLMQLLCSCNCCAHHATAVLMRLLRVVAPVLMQLLCSCGCCFSNPQQPCSCNCCGSHACMCQMPEAESVTHVLTQMRNVFASSTTQHDPLQTWCFAKGQSARFDRDKDGPSSKANRCWRNQGALQAASSPLLSNTSYNRGTCNVPINRSLQALNKLSQEIPLAPMTQRLYVTYLVWAFLALLRGSILCRQPLSQIACVRRPKPATREVYEYKTPVSNSRHVILHCLDDQYYRASLCWPTSSCIAWMADGCGSAMSVVCSKLRQ